jgi:hypothetical protein
MDLSLPEKVLKSRLGLTSLFLLLITFLLDFPVVDLPILISVKNAEAVVGRPGTPASVAGVHRRTRRRTRRRWAVGTRMYTLPVGYTTAVVAGTTYYVSQGEYFKPSYEGDTVVYVAVEDPKETSAGKAAAQTQPPQAQPAQTQPAQAQPASTDTAEQKLIELKSLYDKGLIDKQEYDAKKKEILNSM